jgi:hypothetical protein
MSRLGGGHLLRAASHRAGQKGERLIGEGMPATRLAS